MDNVQSSKQLVQSAHQSSWSLWQKLCVLVYRNYCFFLQARSASTSSFRSVSQVMKSNAWSRLSIFKILSIWFWSRSFSSAMVFMFGSGFIRLLCDWSFVKECFLLFTFLLLSIFLYLHFLICGFILKIFGAIFLYNSNCFFFHYLINPLL